MRKKLLAAALIGTACMTATACSQSGSTGEMTAAQTTEAGSEEAASTEAETEETEKEEASEPITIAFWHDRTSDTDLAYLQKSIQEFNETNELGITVEEVAQGYLDDVQAAIEQLLLQERLRNWLTCLVMGFLCSHQREFWQI